MTTRTDAKGRRFRGGFALAGMAVAAVLMAATAAQAGECPAGKAGKNPLKDAASAPAGVTDKVLSSIALAKEKLRLDDHLFRLRRLEIQPGGIVPMHNHGDRPALIYIISGTIEEYSSNCTVPVVHRAGEAAMESVGLRHWWKNTGDEAVVLISADILHTEKYDGKMM